jgi:hypothetical protein
MWVDEKVKRWEMKKVMRWELGCFVATQRGVADQDLGSCIMGEILSVTFRGHIQGRQNRYTRRSTLFSDVTSPMQATVITLEIIFKKNM